MKTSAKQSAYLKKLIVEARVQGKELSEPEALALLNDAFFAGIFSHSEMPVDLPDEKAQAIICEWIGDA